MMHLPVLLVLLLSAVDVSAAQPIGRLFFTPAERTMLDEARRRPEPVVQEPPKEVEPPPEIVTVTGVVRRSDGSTTVWINDRAVTPGRVVDGLEVAPAGRTGVPGRVTLRVPQTGRSVEIAVGQQYDLTSGTLSERYQLSRPSPAEAEQTPAPAATPRRAPRERELLRELLRELDGPASTGAASPTEAPGSTPGSPRP